MQATAHWSFSHEISCHNCLDSRDALDRLSTAIVTITMELLYCVVMRTIRHTLLKRSGKTLWLTLNRTLSAVLHWWSLTRAFTQTRNWWLYSSLRWCFRFYSAKLHRKETLSLQCRDDEVDRASFERIHAASQIYMNLLSKWIALIVSKTRIKQPSSSDTFESLIVAVECTQQCALWSRRTCCTACTGTWSRWCSNTAPCVTIRNYQRWTRSWMNSFLLVQDNRTRAIVHWLRRPKERSFIRTHDMSPLSPECAPLKCTSFAAF